MADLAGIGSIISGIGGIGIGIANSVANAEIKTPIYKISLEGTTSIIPLILSALPEALNFNAHP